MSYCMYLRKSRADLETESGRPGDTLLRHEQALSELASRLKLPVNTVYRELVSGETIAARPVMQKLLSEVERGLWEGVLVMEVERLARGDTVDQGVVARTFRYAGTRIVTPLKTFDPSDEFDEEYFEFGLFMSRREYKLINRRLQRGRLASVREGKFVGSRAPFGYRRVRLEGRKGFTLAPVPEEAAAVRLAFAWYTGETPVPGGKKARPGLGEIARRLEALAIPSPGGGAWSTATLQNILRNPVYAGFIRWNCRKTVKQSSGGVLTTSRPRACPEDWLLIPGLHPPLINPALFDKAGLLLKSCPGKPGPGALPMKNPLSGLLRCGVCGRTMVRRPGKIGSPDSLFCPAPGCPTVESSLSAVEKCLLGALADWTVLPLLPEKPPGGESAQELSGLLEKQLLAIARRKDSACSLLERGIYDGETYLRRKAALEAREQDLRAALKLAGSVSADLPRPSRSPRAVSVSELYLSAPTPAEKNRLLRSLLEKAEYRKQTRIRWCGGRDSLILILFPRLPPAMLGDNPPVRKN